MQLTPHNGKIVEKIFRDKDGRLVRANFCVYENAGRIKARLVDFVYIAEQILLAGATYFLPGFAKTKLAFAEVSNGISYSPSYFNVNNIYFSGSKPRAPTFA